MRRVTSGTPFSLQRRMLVGEWALLIGVTLDASRVCAGSQSGLLEFKTAMWIMTVTALHHSFENLVMERRAKLRLHLTMTADAQLGLPDLQHANCRNAGFLSVGPRHQNV